MPVPLAHPAAIMPFRRYCARRLSFPALVIGSLVPDAGYLFDDAGLGGLSHQFLGSIAFGFPVGVLLLALLYGFRSWIVGILPPSQQRIFFPLCRRPVGPLWIAAISLVIGIWTHVFWDSFTHIDGWIVQQVPILQTPVLQFAGRTARLCHVLWYLSSFAGAGWLFLAFEKWKLGVVTSGAMVGNKMMIRDATVLAILVVPISLIHHLVRSPIGIVLTAAFSVLLALQFVFKIESEPG
jgi:hypothetical protein